MIKLRSILTIAASGACAGLTVACAPTVTQQACAENNASPAVSVETQQIGKRPGLLTYYQRLLNSTTEEQNREYQLLNNDHTQDDLGTEQLRLALVLSLPNAEFRDDQRAKALLVEYFQQGGGSNEADVALARVLQQMLSEREQHDREHRDAQQALESERQQRKTLQTQLDQLKAIEKDIIEKEQSVVAPLPENSEHDSQIKDSPGR